MKQFLKQSLACFVGSIVAMLVVAGIGVITIATMVATTMSGMTFYKDQKVDVEDNSVLRIQFDQPIADRGTKPRFDFSFLGGVSMSRKMGLNDILENVEKAAKDERIEGIYLDLSSVPSGMATLKEIRKALTEFKDSGKFVISHSQNFTHKGYYLTSTADRLSLHPEGGMTFQGLSSEIMYMKGMLDKINMDVQILRGPDNKYKSAVEPLIYEEMTDANRRQTQAYLNDQWQELLSDISESRGISTEKLNTYADSLSIRDAEDALDRGMVDTIRYKDQFLADLRERLDVETNDDINYVKFPEYMDAELPDKKDKKEKEKKSDKEIAVVYCTGGIEGGKGGPATIGSKETSEAIRDARKDSSVKAVVLRVNSPGGSALASDVIWREVVLTRDEKPVVVSMGDVAASGGYYISCAADHIYAMPNTITGSIGVFGIIPNTEPFYEENLDINFERVRTNPHADLGTINRAMNKKERKVMNQGIVETYQTFIEKVAKGRDMSTEMVDSLGRGRVWSGLDALDNGLVDELGGMKKAIEKAAELAEIEDYETRALPEIKSPIEKVMDKLTGKARTKLIKSEFGDHGYRIYKRFRYIRSLTKMEGIQARLPYQVTVR